MAETPVNHDDDTIASKDESVCKRCGGTGYIDNSRLLSYGDPGYGGDPECNKEPCPDCNYSQYSANLSNSTPKDNDAAWMLSCLGIVILVGVILSVIIWLAR
jgi:hypothetical protein